VQANGQATKPRNPTELISHNCHFSPNTLEALALHSSLRKSGGVSGLVRTVMEYFLATTINWDDPQYRDVDRIPIPPERYPGQHAKLGLL
jgi:hypothetical protein